MPHPPLFEKNAFLTISISSDSITANLAYSHYDIGRTYVSHDVTYFDDTRDAIDEQRFWDEYFQSLGIKLDWKIVNTVSSDIGLAQIVDFVDEGVGVSGISFQVHHALKNRTKILSVVHTYLPTAEMRVNSNEVLETYLPRLINKLGYKDAIIVNADLERFDLYRVKAEEDEGGGRSIESTKIYWDSKTHLIDSIKDKRLAAFSAIDVTPDEITNLWANYIFKPINIVLNAQLSDVLRAFFTVQLVTMYNNKENIVGDFARDGRSSLVVITGKLASILTEKEILLGTLDGLQMRGHFDIFIDTDSRFLTFGEKYAEGINTKEYIVPKEVVLPHKDKVFVLEVAGKASDKKAVFIGEMHYEKGKKEDLYVLTPDISRFTLPNKLEDTIVFSGQFVKGAYVEGFGEEFIFTSSQESGFYRNVFFDARFKPIVYGPDFRTNKNKLKYWLSE